MRTLRVLIAEDDGLTALNLKEQLHAMGHEVIGVAGTGREAVEKALAQSPDLVTLDITMPDMDGLEAARQIMEQSPAALVMVTAHSERSHIERAVECGVMSYLVKPIAEKDLHAALEVAMQRFVEMQSLRHEVNDLKETLEARKQVERAKGVLMKRQGLTEEEAFVRMQKESQNRNRKLADIANAIIEAEAFL